jgi:hypothetical protein
MKKLLIALALSTTFMACNSGNKETNEDKGVNDTTEMGENVSAGAQQSSADTNVNKIGTDNAVSDSTKADSINKKK